MVNIPYKKIVTILADSYQIYNAPAFKLPEDWDGVATISLEDYVFATAYTPILHMAFGRSYNSLSILNYYFLNKDRSRFPTKTVLECLEWYYSDMSNLLYVIGVNANNVFKDYSIQLNVDKDSLRDAGIPEIICDYDEELVKVLKALHSTEPVEYTQFLNMTYSKLELQDNENALKSLVLSCILKRYRTSNSFITIKEKEEVLI